MGQSPSSNYYNENADGIPFIQGITEFGRLYPKFKIYTSKFTKISEKNDILFTVRAPVGELNINTTKCCIGRGIAAIIPIEKSNRFLFYLLNFNKNLFKLKSSGAIYDSINKDNLANTVLKYPSLKENRDSISNILMNYDDLIENNQRRIELLEKSAELIYKEWFVNLRFPGYEKTKIVNGIPNGWEKKKIGELLKKINRKKKIPKDDYLDSGNIPCIDQSTNFIGGFTNDKDALHMEPLPIIIFGDHTRILKYIDFPFASGADGTQLIYPKGENISVEYLYLSLINVNLSNYYYARHFKFLKECEILISSSELIIKFTNIIKPIFNQIINLKRQIILLSKARDLLIPKLINGEIEV